MYASVDVYMCVNICMFVYSYVCIYSCVYACVILCACMFVHVSLCVSVVRRRVALQRLDNRKGKGTENQNLCFTCRS